MSVELEGYAKLDPYVTAGLYFGVSILSGKLKVSAGIEAKASLLVTASVAVKGGTDTATTFQGCQGVTVSLDAKLEIASGEHLIFHILSVFIPDVAQYSYRSGNGQLAPDVPVPILTPTVPNATYRIRTINAQVKNAMLHVLWLPKPNGNLVAIPPTEVVDGPGSIHRLFQSLTSERNAAAGVYDNQVLHINALLMHFAHASPLILSPKDAVPKHSLVVVLRSEIGSDGPPIAKLVMDGPPFEYCHFASFTITMSDDEDKNDCALSPGLDSLIAITCELRRRDFPHPSVLAPT
ncbi:hypothetical protein C8J57DRAFT_1527341 [Mycena rebaudengoi]|nr:hypothetical protein C8J57DRAFT_1527341 [Mycena rebaudengoi]